MRAADRDLTGEARIRAAAMRSFAAHGVSGASMREIATAAGVSPSLVVHHFGTKEGLKRAVDARAMELLTGLLEGLADELDSPGSASQAMYAALRDEPDLTAYLRRLLMDADASGRALFSGLVAATIAQMAELERSGVVRPAKDPRTRSVFLLVNDLAVILLRDLITDALGTDPLGEEGLRQWAETAMDTYGSGLFPAHDNESSHRDGATTGSH